MTHRGKLLGAGLAVLVLVSGGCVPRWAFGPKVAAARAVRQDLTQTLVVNGRVLAPRRVTLGAQVAGVVVARSVEEGDRVKAGQILVRLEASEAQANLAQARARLDQIRQVADPSGAAGLKQAEAALLQAELAFDRSERLQREGILSATQMDEVRRNRDGARAARDAAQAQARSAARGADLRSAQAAVDVAQARLDQLTLRAPADGVVLTRSVEVGDAVTAGRGLLILLLDEPLQLLVQPDEKHLAQLRLGQGALASADAFPDRRFRAEVAYVAPAVDPLRGTVDVKLRVPQAPDFLRPDMTLSVEIEQGRRPGAVSVPVGALRGLPGTPHVFVREEGRVVRRAVRPGLRGETAVEILEGLQGGEVVILEPLVRPGQRVRARMEP